ncbi:hypothetical protein VCRA2113O140_110121 [Vibrio crassostreae]|nr:hypothetical protein VCRA2113O140_110121 [Vibrio crassostreae]CAK3099085.1 hypothetical protein VCRA2121O156_110121 [Vibrio crassostreae]CAK3126777.1 hypothetical protein VCRA2121O154_90130 [Vibrio crassostreae]CAK3205932.1 hypothetical protein VCRA2127O160_90131 [Vibrio crassostreae]
MLYFKLKYPGREVVQKKLDSILILHKNRLAKWEEI